MNFYIQSKNNTFKVEKIKDEIEIESKENASQSESQGDEEEENRIPGGGNRNEQEKENRSPKEIQGRKRPSTSVNPLAEIGTQEKGCIGYWV